MAKTSTTPTQKKTSTKSTKTKPKTEPSVIAANTILSLTVPWSSLSVAYDKVLQRQAKKLKLKGFRKGQVPKKLAEEQLDKGALLDQALQIVVPPLYQELIQKAHKQPLTHPEFKPVSAEWGKDWVLEVQIAEKPTVSVGNYKKIVTDANKVATQELQTLAKELEAHQHHDQSDGHTHPDPVTQEREVRLHQIFSALVQTIRPTIPELLLKEETRDELRRLQHELEKIGLTLENYLQRKNQSFEDLSQELAAQTLGQLQLAFILEEIETQEKIEVTQADRDQELAKISDKKLQDQMKNDPRYAAYIDRQLRRNKLLDWMVKLT